MSEHLSLKETQKEWHGSIKAYLWGFILSFLLTSLSFFLVYVKAFSSLPLTYTIIILAVIQAAVQIIFFLHIGQEPKPKWESIALCFTLMVLLILVVGSLWIMHDLDNRVMPMHMEVSSHD